MRGVCALVARERFVGGMSTDVQLQLALLTEGETTNVTDERTNSFVNDGHVAFEPAENISQKSKEQIDEISTHWSQMIETRSDQIRLE